VAQHVYEQQEHADVQERSELYLSTANASQHLWPKLYTKMLDCFNPNLGQIWTNPNVGLKM